MRTCLTLLILLFTYFSNGLKAQVTYPFLHTGSAWGQLSGYIAFINWEWTVVGTTSFMASNADTLINSKSYIKICSSDSLGNPGSFVYGLIREDSSGKVWWYNVSDDADMLLYNFSLNTGDTITVNSPYQWGPEPIMVVDSIGSISVLGSQRKAIYFNTTSLNYGLSITGGHLYEVLVWIEGIGSNAGLFYPTGGNLIPDGTNSLSCYREYGLLAFGEVCNIVLSQHEGLVSRPYFEILSNPAISVVPIHYSITQPAILTVTDILGKVIREELLSPALNEKMIGIDNWAKGFYFITLFEGSNRLTRQVVIN